MRTLKRLGTGVLAIGVAAAGMLMTPPAASAHTGTLTTSAVCNDDGTRQITYTGETTGVPPRGLGHVATLVVGEVRPTGSTITDVPPTVTGNTTYSFHQIVAGTVTYAQATAFLTWGDGAKSDPIGRIDLPRNCPSPPTPVAPSGELSTDCVEGGGHVVASHLDSGTAEDVTWRLVSRTAGSGDVVVAGPSSSGPLEASGLKDGTTVWLQYDAGQGFVDEDSVVTTGHCTPPVVVPTGSFTVVCSETGGDVTVGELDSGNTEQDVVWTLYYGTQAKTVSSGDVVAVPALAALALKYTVGGGDSHQVQSGTAPEACAPTGGVDKTSVPASGSVVGPGQTVTYSVTVTNTGAVRFEDKPAVDTLPDHVSLVPGSITGDGTASADGRSITWSVSLDPQDSATYTYQVTVDADAPSGASLLNRVVFLQDEATTTHEVGEGSLEIVKSVTPTGDAEFGDTLTYTLKVTASGSLGQTAVVVTDDIPSLKSGRDSGTTTYVPDSAACDAGTCTAVYDAAANLVTWSLGDMAPGTSRTVTFQVTIDTPNNLAEGVPAVTIYNSAAVSSTETPSTPSNEVQTPVTAILGVHHDNPNDQPTEVLGSTLPHTGAPDQLPWTLAAAGLLVLVGSSLILVARKPAVARVR